MGDRGTGTLWSTLQDNEADLANDHVTKASLSEVAMWPDIASEVYLLTGFCKGTGILTGLWLHMAGGGVV